MNETGRPAVWLSGPASCLALIAVLTAFVFQPGNLGGADAEQRLQVAHSWWTGEPEVNAQRFPGFGVPGRDGKLHAWWGLGQSLLFLPLDVPATLVVRAVPPLRDLDARLNGDLRKVPVTYLYQAGIATAGVLTAWQLLLALGFLPVQAVAGALSLLFGTTFLHYLQNAQENDLMLVLAMLGVLGGLRWIETGSRRALWLGMAALGFDIVVRAPTVFDVAAAILVLLMITPARKRRDLIWTAAPFLAASVVIDRVYQYVRFGDAFGTYTALLGIQAHALNPSLPPSYPFSTPLAVGFFGALFSPEASVFLFDPLLIVTFVVGALAWRRLTGQMRAFVLAGLLLMVCQIVFYGRYFAWYGAVSWGDRFLSTPVQWLALLGVPLWMRARQGGRLLRVVVTAVLIIQLASTFFPMSLEYAQQANGIDTYFRIGQRVENIGAYLASGRVPAAAAIPNYAPFLVREKVPALFPAAMAVWGVLWVGLLFFTTKALRHRQDTWELSSRGAVRGFW